MPILAESRWNIEVLFPSQTSRSGKPLFFVFFLRFWGVSTKSDISAIVNHKPDRTEFIQSVCDVTRCSYLPNRSTNPTFFLQEDQILCYNFTVEVEYAYTF